MFCLSISEPKLIYREIFSSKFEPTANLLTKGWCFSNTNQGKKNSGLVGRITPSGNTLGQNFLPCHP